jgi:hypothetical protein
MEYAFPVGTAMNSKERGPAWEANDISVGQESSHLL